MASVLDSPPSEADRRPPRLDATPASTRRRTAREALALGAVVVLLTTVPAVVSLLRHTSYRAEAVLVPVSRGTSAAEALSSARRQATAPGLRITVAADKGRAWTTYSHYFERITVQAGSGRSVVLSVPAATPKEATATAGFVVERLALVTRDIRRASMVGTDRIRAIDTLLRTAPRSARQRRRLVGERHFLRVYLASLGRRSVPFQTQGQIRGPRLNAVDRAFERLHAEDLPRAAPGWAALAGLLLGLALSALWLMMRQPTDVRQVRGPAERRHEVENGHTDVKPPRTRLP